MLRDELFSVDGWRQTDPQLPGRPETFRAGTGHRPQRGQQETCPKLGRAGLRQREDGARTGERVDCE